MQNGDYLRGYSTEEIKVCCFLIRMPCPKVMHIMSMLSADIHLQIDSFVALLVRYHRKEFPKVVEFSSLNFLFRFVREICGKDGIYVYFCFFSYYFQVKKKLKFLCAIIYESLLLYGNINAWTNQTRSLHILMKVSNLKTVINLSPNSPFLFLHTAQTGKAHNLESILGQRFLFLFFLRIFHWFSLYLTHWRQLVLSFLNRVRVRFSFSYDILS